MITVPSGTEPAAAPVGPPLVVADLEGTCTSGETWRTVRRWLMRRLADVLLLELAAEAIAVAPDRALRAVAIGRGWRILDDSPGTLR